MNYLNLIGKVLLISFIFLLNDVSQKETIIVPNKDKEIVINNQRYIKDILFINGCDINIVPQSYRYRVLHQMEQLNAAFLECDEINYLNLDPLNIRDYRVIIFFRCPWTENINKAIELAKSLNKKVLFDIDDLVIDTKYTNMIPYIKTLQPDVKKIYNDGVERMGKTLKMCDGVITTTDTLAKELKNYISNVYINRNVASEEMWNLSELALKKQENKTKSEDVIIGYFSGSITHNSDLESIKPSLIDILKEFKNVKIFLFGKINITHFLDDYSSQIIYNKFVDWKELPEIISNVDINIAPIIKNIFNEAKSENKWVEASLVKVPTIASNIGAFKEMIENNKTGLLCSDLNDWYISLKTLIKNENLRKAIGENAYNVCKNNYNTIYTGNNLANFINSISNKHIGFFLPSLKISGGLYVILKHACFLKDEGWDVDLIITDANTDFYEFQNHKFNIIELSKSTMTSQYDVIVATLFTTIFNILNYYKTKKHIYLVQNYETDFYHFGDYFRGIAEKTYSLPFGIEYVTISKWCENWLLNKYNKKSRYAPNGIDYDNYFSHRRNLNKEKIRILIEGDSSSDYKNVDESFKIVQKLDKNKFEIWYLSYNGQPKNWYRVDKFLNGIPFKEVNKVYENCDILLKSSWLESFSYPPLEMMSTGGYCIVVPNGGNKEYLKDGYNCLFYKLGDIDNALNCITRLISDKNLQEHLFINGIKSAQKRDWKHFKSQIISLYDNE